LQQNYAAFLNDAAEVLRQQRQPAEAIKSYRAVQEILERLVKGDPGNEERQRNLALSHIQLAEALMEKRELARALASCQTGLQSSRALRLVRSLHLAERSRIGV
jgi:tetratricopeptide (TPR) repeat protein